jgi:uncharacterized repeat protein (TIGR03803 family)
MQFATNRKLFYTGALVAVFAARLMAQAGGGWPRAGVIRDSAGNLYGTTYGGGAYNAGTVFVLSPTGVETVLYTFQGGTDAGWPYGGVIRDSAGNLYGTTVAGGAYGRGTVFMLSPTGVETVLYSFQGSWDGVQPQAGVIRDSAGNLYGTTSYGGAYSSRGTVFMLSTTGVKTVLHSFQPGGDGFKPCAGVIRDSAGNLYGTTTGGGHENGTVFKLSPTGSEKVLHKFKGGTDGANPAFSGVIRDSAGNLYGTTSVGGATNTGTVFVLSPTGLETVLYSFQGGTDGANPQAGVIRDSAGNLYGTTMSGGAYGNGTVFQVSPTGVETVLYSFQGGTDGANPQAGVIRDSAGNLYGTTYVGGANNAGTVFVLSPTGVETVLYSF